MLLVIAIVRFVRRVRRRGSGRSDPHAVDTIVFTAAVVYVWFLLFWGLNYRRLPLEQKLDYDASRITREQALQLGRTAVDQVNALASQARPAATRRR